MATQRNTQTAARSPMVPAVIMSLSPATARLVARAIKAMEKEAVYRADSESMSCPGAARDFLKLKLAKLEREEFHALWLDAQNRLIAFECLFVGTLTETAVYAREVVKAALAHNAAGVIFAHNHPSGTKEPSTADRMLTDSLKNALRLVDVKVLDHIIVAGMDRPLSMAEEGMI